MSFRLTGLSAGPFRHLYGLTDHALAAKRAKRYLVDGTPGFPDRVEMRDLEPGETALLVHYTHQSASTPYHASHAVFVREFAETTYEATDEIPQVEGRASVVRYTTLDVNVKRPMAALARPTYWPALIRVPCRRVTLTFI